MDRHPSCPEYARSGMCESNKQWMLEYCQKTCPGARCDRAPKRPPGNCNNPLGLHADLNQRYRVPDSAFFASTQLDPGGGFVLDLFKIGALYYDFFHRYMISVGHVGGFLFFNNNNNNNNVSCIALLLNAVRHLCTAALVPLFILIGMLSS